MKFLLALFFICFFSFSIKANPVMVSAPLLNEILMDENGNWYVEVYYEYWDSPMFTYDSIVLTTTSSRCVFNLPALADWMGFFVLDKTLVGDAFLINLEKDSLFMEVFMQEGMVANKTQLIIFGDLPGSMVEKPESGQSIVRIEGMEQWYVLDDSPTIGALNDLEGVAGIISGTIFHQGNPIWESKKFWFDFSFKLQAAGTYECRVLKGNRQFSKIGRAYSWDEGCEWFSIEPIDIMIEADSIYTQVDIIITDPTFVNITDNYRKDITCYPNPASDKIYINGTFLTGARVCLSDLKGSVIQEFKLNAFSGKQELTLQKNLTGIYVLTINENGQTTFSDQLLINPFK